MPGLAAQNRSAAAGATTFILAADRADTGLMRELLQLGVDPQLPNVNGTTPLLATAGVGTTSPDEDAGDESEAIEAVNLLLDLGADINAVDNNGDTAMHGTAYNATLSWPSFWMNAKPIPTYGRSPIGSAARPCSSPKATVIAPFNLTPRRSRQLPS